MKRKIIQSIFMAGFCIFAFVYLFPYLIANIPEDTPAHIKGLYDVMPIVYVATAMLGIVGLFITGQVVYTIYKWNALGNRMKEAYKAKYFGENPAFNAEVDMHIHSVRTLGKKSWKRSTDIDWIKRMCVFVDIPFIVPEEEHESELEKTKSFDDGKEA